MSTFDTALSCTLSSGEDGIISFPMEAHEVTKEGLKEKFPNSKVLELWYNGEDAEWPPLDDKPLQPQLPL